MTGDPIAEIEEQYGTFLVQHVDKSGLPPEFLEQFSHHFTPGQYRFEGVAERTHVQFLRAVALWTLQDQFGLPEEITDPMILVFEEVVSNVLRHSYYSQDSKWLCFCLSREGNQIIVEVLDRGEGGRNPEIPAKLASISKEGRPPLKHRGGLGLYLMRRVMDEIEYLPGGPLNLMVLKKNIA